MGGQVRRQQSLKKPSTSAQPCSANVHLTAGPPGPSGHTPPSLPPWHCMQTPLLAAPSRPAPHAPPHSPPPASSRAHAHLSSPRVGAETVSLARSRGGGGGRPRIPFLPSPNKDEGTQVVLVFILFFFSFFQYTSLSFKKRDIKKKRKKRQKNV